MSAHVELEEFVTADRVEWAHRRASYAQRSQQNYIARAGWRAAVERDGKMLKVLELATKILQRMSEQQMGVHGHDVDGKGLYVEATEYQLWREAYKAMDEGRPMQHFQWIYGAAALMLGYAD